MKTKKIFSLTLAFVLTGCGSFPHSPSQYTASATATHFDSELFNDFAKGAIVLSAQNHLGANYTIYNYITIYSMDNPNIKYDLKMKNNQPQIVMLSPGKYKLTNISFFGSMNAGNMHFQTDLDLGDTFFAEFSVAPGAAVYVGNLRTTTRYGKREGGGLFMSSTKTPVSATVEAIDDFDKLPTQTKKDIESKFSGKLKTQLLNVEHNTKGN